MAKLIKVLNCSKSVIKTKDRSGFFCFLWIASLYVVYVAAMLVTMASYTASSRRPDVVLRGRAGGIRTFRIRRESIKNGYCFTY